MRYIAEYVALIEGESASEYIEVPVGDFVVQPSMGTVAWYVETEADSMAEAKEKLQKIVEGANTPKRLAGFKVADGWSLYEITIDPQGDSWIPL